jgi:signal peptidase I
MKRALGLAIIVAIVIVGFFSIRGAMPFVPILGTSMDPEFKAGDLIMIDAVSVSEVQVGDVIVFTVPPLVREAYDYPEVVVHRVVRAYTTDRETTFRTRGDNVDGEDPFMVRAKDVKGQPGTRIPFLGFPLLFLQSQHGLIFVVVSLCLLTLYLYAEELSLGSGKVQKRLLAPVIEENRQSSHLLQQRIENTEKGMVGAEQTLMNFTSAIDVYAEHLKSHTSAIQGLSDASQELKHSAAEQNRVLSRVAEVMEQIAPMREDESTCEAEIEVLMIEEDTEESLEENEIAADNAFRAAERDLKERFAHIYEELLLDSARRENRHAAAIPNSNDMTWHELHKSEATKSARLDELRKEAIQEMPPVDEEQSEGNSPVYYEGRVELTIQSPLKLHCILQLFRSLRSIAEKKSLDLRLSEDNRIIYSLVLREPAPLLQILQELPEVAEIHESQQMSTIRQTGVQLTVTEFILTMKN